MVTLRREIRKKRIEKALSQGISEIMLFEMNDERLKNEMITITKVTLSDDLEHAAVHFKLYYPENKNKVIKLLYQTLPYFYSFLKKKIIIKKIPIMKFFYDQAKEATSLEVVNLIEKLSEKYKKNTDS